MGVTKTRSSSRIFPFDLLVKKKFTTGMFIRPGHPSRELWFVLLMIPPMTAVSPSFTIILVSASWVRIGGFVAEITKLGELSVIFIFMLIRPSAKILGVTSKRRSASTNWVCVPFADTVVKGIVFPFLMLAF